MPMLLEPGQRPTCVAVIGAFLLCKVFIQRLVDQRQGGDFALTGLKGKPGNLVWFKIIEISLQVFVFV